MPPLLEFFREKCVSKNFNDETFKSKEEKWNSGATVHVFVLKLNNVQYLAFLEESWYEIVFIVTVYSKL